MTHYDAYIGDLDDPDFKWEGGDWNGNTPPRLSPYFPPCGITPDMPFWWIKDRVESGKLVGKQTDWGAWTAKVGKKQIIGFMYEYYDHRKSNMMPHLRQQLEELRKFVDSLEDGKMYALVAVESG